MPLGRLAGRAESSWNWAAIVEEGEDMGLGPGLEGAVSFIEFDWNPIELPWCRVAAPGARDVAFGPDETTVLVPVRIPDRHEVWIYDVSDPRDVGDPPVVLETGAEGGLPAGIAVSIPDERAFVIDGDPARMFVVDLSGPDPEVRGSVEVPGASFAIAVQP